MMLMVVQPVMARHSKHQQMFSTVAGGAEVFKAEARGEWRAELTEIAATLNVKDRLEELGYGCLSMEERLDRMDAADDQTVARYHYQLAVNLLGQRALRGLMHTNTLPMALASLVDEGVQPESVLPRFEQMWTTLVDAESSSYTNNAVRDILDRLVWPQLPWH
eukprot:3027776-Amphidinium_carterae.1